MKSKIILFFIIISCQYSFSYDFKEWKIYFFLSPECPLCQSYSLEINNVQNQYKANGFHFIGVFSTEYSTDSIQLFVKKYNLSLEILMDSSNTIINKYNATVTPQVIIVSDKDKIVYSGAIDNWAVSLGVKRTVITKKYLQENLNELIHNRKVKYSNNIPIGCIIQN